MRYIKVSTAILLLFLLLPPAASTAAASDDLHGLVAKISDRLDGRWARVTERHSPAGAVSAPDGTMTVSRRAAVTGTVSRRSAATRAGARPSRSPRPAGGAMKTPGRIDGSRLTRHGRDDFLWRTTRSRNDPVRGVSKLSSPAKATLAGVFKRRLPRNNAEKYRRTVGSGRAGVWRKSPRMGTRRLTSGTRRRHSSPSMTRGATRVRRTATRGF